MENRWQNGCKVLVVGAGKSGVAAAKALARLGARVTICDEKPLAAISAGDELLQAGIEVFAGGYPSVVEQGFSEVLMSPGVPLTVAPAKEAEKNGIPLTGELELAYVLSPVPFIAITGTNGKTTTTSLVGSILAEAGWKPFVGGNIGQPLVEEVQKLSRDQWVVAEVSSFQLETTETFRPKLSMILNITPDHLDRHGTMEQYRAIKARIFANQTDEDITVLNGDDSLVGSLANQCRGKVLLFSRKERVSAGTYLRNGVIWFIGANSEVPVIPIHEMALKGVHNVENALAACAGAIGLGIAPSIVAEVLRGFKPVEHRMEPAGMVAEVEYINDSKGTNPDAAIKAIESYDKPIVLIAGGKNKGSDFSELAAVIKKRVRALVLVGQAAEIIEQTVRKTGFERIVRVSEFQETVTEAAKLAESGDIVLLSPACASLDMFANYEERGRTFKELVAELKAAKNSK